MERVVRTKQAQYSLLIVLCAFCGPWTASTHLRGGGRVGALATRVGSGRGESGRGAFLARSRWTAPARPRAPPTRDPNGRNGRHPKYKSSSVVPSLPPLFCHFLYLPFSPPPKVPSVPLPQVRCCSGTAPRSSLVPPHPRCGRVRGAESRAGRTWASRSTAPEGPACPAFSSPAASSTE